MLSVNLCATTRPAYSFRSGMLALSILCAYALPARTAITLDSTSSQKAAQGVTTLTWNHVLGTGTNRMLVCGVSIANPDTAVAPGNPTVTFDGVAATPVAGSQAPTPGEGRTSKIETELFYIPDASLGNRAGTYTVIVTLPSGPTGGTVAGCTSLFGVNQAPAEAVGTFYNGNNVATSVTLTTTTPGDWIIDVYGGSSGSGGVVTPNAGQTQLYNVRLAGTSTNGTTTAVTGASSYLPVPNPGAVTIGWSAGSSREANSAAAFAPAEVAPSYTLTTAVNPAGGGTITVSPNQATYPSGTVVQLTATGAPTFTFTNWSGDLTGAANPASITMDGNKSVTANFAQNLVCKLTVNVVGSGNVRPGSGSYPCGTQLTITEQPAQSWEFSGWSGNLSGNASSVNITLNTSQSVSATFVFSTGTGGDTRTVTEPVFPPVCSVVTAAQSSAALDETAPDTARVQKAINACPVGQAVRFSPGGGNDAFLIAPITLKAGVTMLLDPEVTIFGSINHADYSCDASSGWCNPLIDVATNTDPAPGSGIMGYGVIDGRGGVTSTDTGQTWWANPNAARPRLIFLGDHTSNASADNFTLYRITLENSPEFHVSGVGNNLTVWDIKIMAPPDSPNTDGIDPSGSQNVTITQSYISDGDDHIAPKAGVAHVSNVTISNDHLYTGHGISIGSETNAGLNNMYVHDIAIDNGFGGTSANSLRIKSDSSEGGEVYDVLYQNVCILNGGDTLVFNPYYSTGNGTLIPNFHDIRISSLHLLNHSSSKSTMIGYNTSGIVHPLSLTLDNVSFDGFSPSDFVAPGNINNVEFTLGPGPVNFASALQSIAAVPSNNVMVTNNITNNKLPLDCSNAFVYLAGELTAPVPSVTVGSSVTVTAILQKLVGDPIAGGALLPQQNPPTGTISLLEGTNVVATGTISGRITYLSVASVSPGSHTYTAEYSGDANYPQLNFGSVQITATYPWTGFLPPVANPPTQNVVEAGRAIPIQFSLGGDQGLNIFASGYPAVQPVSCSTGMPIGGLTPTVTPGNSGLNYDPASNTYTYVWKSDRSLAGTCQQLVLGLADGSNHVANFQFK